MGAVIQLNFKKYELQYQQFYRQGKLNLKDDIMSKSDAARYIAKLNHKKQMKNILSVVK